MKKRGAYSPPFHIHTNQSNDSPPVPTLFGTSLLSAWYSHSKALQFEDVGTMRKITSITKIAVIRYSFISILSLFSCVIHINQQTCYTAKQEKHLEYFVDCSNAHTYCSCHAKKRPFTIHIHRAPSNSRPTPTKVKFFQFPPTTAPMPSSPTPPPDVRLPNVCISPSSIMLPFG